MARCFGGRALSDHPPTAAVWAPDSAQSLAVHLQSSTESFRIVGAGTWLGAGRPVRAQQSLHTTNICGIVEYVPGDLTMTVRAGTTLAEIDLATAREGQWLGVDAAGSAAGTIGATVATASAGPLALGVGRIRDIVLGLEVVTGDGRLTRSGGKVVKNVAGFDIVRLQTGAWGTLGIITEMSVRLRALPEVDETIAITLDPRKPLAACIVPLRDLALAPLALELVSGSLAAHLGIGNGVTLLVRLGGNEPRVRAQRLSLASLGTLQALDNNTWSKIRTVERDAGAVARVSHLPSELGNTWKHVHAELTTAGLAPALVRGSVRGMLRVVIPQSAAASAPEFLPAVSSVARTLAPPGGHVVWEQLPAQSWEHVSSAVGDRLSSGLQRAFDPMRRCNPGIMGQPQ